MENKSNRNIILGTVIVILGGLLLLNNFDILGAPIKEYIISWKTLLIVIGLAMMAKRKNLIGGIFVASLGIIFWLPEIFNHQFQLGHVFLPAMLVVVGIVLLVKSGILHTKRNHDEKFVQYEELDITESETQAK